MKYPKFQKIVAAITAILLVCFLIVHAGINMCTLSSDPDLYNGFSNRMDSMVIIKIMKVLIDVCLLLHIILSARFAIKKRKLQPTEANRENRKSAFVMMVTGMALLLFLFFHAASFSMAEKPAGGYYEMTHTLFSSAPKVIVNLLFFALVFVHLFFAGKASIHTFELDEKKAKIANGILKVTAIVLFVAYAIIPIVILFS